MRIGHIINNLEGGGAEKLLSVLLPRLNTDHIRSEIIVLNSIGSVLPDALRNSNIPIKVVSQKTVYHPLQVLKLRKYLQGYDIIHTHLFPTQYWVVLAWLLTGRKQVLLTTEHSTYNNRMKYSWLRPLERFIYEKYSRIISISEGTDRTLKTWLKFKSDQQFLTIANGIELAHFRRAVAYSPKQIDPSLHQNDQILIMVARFDDAKDHKTVINALKKLPESYKLMLVGTGPLYEKTVNFVADNQLTSRVLFLGYRNDVANLIKSSYISIVSSHWEGFGLTAIESMAVGIPVIASDVIGLSALVSGAGLLFPAGDASALADKILLLANNVVFRKEIINRQNLRAEQYDLSITAIKYAEVYQSLHHG